jgi:uncharacterized glyoxalase superfamily protein PhnB
MIGAANRPSRASTVAAALDDAVLRLKDRMYRLLATIQARLEPAAPPSAPRPAGTPVIPMLRYRDVPAAIQWLSRAFGMKVHRVEADADGNPCYAELTAGCGMLMIAPIEDTVFGRLLVQPDEIGGVETQVCYLSVANVRAHHARARAAGAVVIIDPDDEVNQGRGYSCRDPEGHLWNFGSYDPWGARPRAVAAGDAGQGWTLRRLRPAMATLGLLLLAGALLMQIAPQPSARASVAAAATPPAPAAAVAPPSSPPAMAPPPAGSVTTAAQPDEPLAAVAARADGNDAEAHRRALVAAERVAEEARARLAEAHGIIEKAQGDARRAEREAATARLQLDQLQRAKEAAERAAADTRTHLAAAQQSAERARAEAAMERARRIAANRAAFSLAPRASASLVRSRPRWARTWCYSPGVPNPGAGSAGRLAGFCKG